MDVVTYALCKKIVSSAASGISDISVNGTDLIFTTNDGKTITVGLPVPQDGISITKVEINNDNHLICVYSNGKTEDAGLVNTVKGDKGEGGVSPTIAISPVDNGHKVSIADINGTQEFNIMNGVNGITDYNDLTNKPDIPVPSKVIDSNSTNETVSTSKAVFDYVISMLASAGFKPLKVDKLPEVGSDRILYLLPKDGLLSENLYDEYLWIDGVYEPVGTTAVDLSNYATVDDLSTKQNQLVVSGYLGSDIDWNTLTSTNIWIIGQASLDDDVTHGLGGVYGYGLLININDRSVNYQFYINDKYQVFLRTKYISWRSWTRLDFNGRPISDPNLDWNTLTSNGIYTIGYNGLIQEESHGPAGVSGWGVLTVTNTGLGQNQTACILQKYESPASGIYYRSLWNSSGDWSPWYKISSTVMTN